MKQTAGANKLIFGAEITTDGGVHSTNFQNIVLLRGNGLENDVKVSRSRNFNWPYLRQFLTRNQNVSRSEVGSSMTLRRIIWTSNFTLKFGKMANVFHKNINLGEYTRY